MPEETTLAITGDGEGMFEAIHYTSAGTYVYTVTERMGSQTGYTYDTAVYTVTVTVTDEDGQLEAAWTAEKDGAESDEIAFTNQYAPAPAQVSIPVKKEITGHATPSDKDFTFTLTAADAAPMPAEDTLTIIGANNGTFGEITFTAAGVYTYTVQEIDGSEPGYTYDTATHAVVVTVTDIGGVLSATWTVDGEEEAEAEFTNSYAPVPANISIPVRKTITGDPTPSDKDFTFTLTAMGGAPMPASDTLTITGANSASFGEITYTTAGTYTYTVREETGSEPGYGYDLAQHTIVVTVTDVDGALSATWTSDGEPAEEVEFTNTYAPNQATLSLPIQKSVEGNPTPADKTFRFALEAQDSAPMPADAVNGVSGASITGSGTSAFGVITYAHAGTYRYTIREITGTDKGYTYDTTEHTVTVTVTDTNGLLSAAWTMDGENADAVAFTNSYTPILEQLRLPVRKAIDGEPPEDARFKFRLSAENGAPMPEGSGDTVEISGEGTGQFGAITYTEAGTYRYTVRELTGSDKGYTYDETEYQVTVTVTDNDGELEAAWSAKKDGAGAQELLFTNVYAPDPVELALGATKTLENGRLTEGMFSFTLSDESGRILETVTNAEDGIVAFPPITYTKAGKYSYIIAEVQGSISGITYDKTAYTVNVTVTDEGGVLTAVADHVPEEVNFVNKYLSTIPKGEIPKTGYGKDRTLYTYTLGLSALMMLGWLIGRKKRTR